MSKFTIVNSKKEATIKTEKDLWRYACNLKRIDISESKVKLFSGLNMSEQDAQGVLDFIQEEDADSIAYELEEKGFKDKEINKMLSKTITKKWKNVCNIKGIDFNNHNEEEKRDYLERIDKAMSILNNKLKIKNPLKFILTEDIPIKGARGLFSEDDKAVYVKKGDDFIITLSHELAHAYDSEITPKFAKEGSIFFNIDNLELQVEVPPKYIMDDKKTNEFMDNMFKEREKFLKDLNPRHILSFNKKKKENLEKQKELAQDLFNTLKEHPFHKYGEGDPYYSNKKEMFARCIELVVKDELDKEFLYQYTKDITLERKPVMSKYKSRLEKLHRNITNNHDFFFRMEYGLSDTQEDKEVAMRMAKSEFNDLLKKYNSPKKLTSQENQEWRNKIVPKTNKLLKELIKQNETIIDKVKKVV